MFVPVFLFLAAFMQSTPWWLWFAGNTALLWRSVMNGKSSCMDSSNADPDGTDNVTGAVEGHAVGWLNRSANS